MANNSVVGMKNITIFSPQTIPGLKLWLDSSDTSSISGTTWSDKSTGKYNVTSTNTITRTSAGITINAIANNVLNNNSIPILASYSLFAVGQTTSASAGGTYYRLVNIGTDGTGLLGTLGTSFATFTGDSSAWNDTSANTPTQTLSQNTQYLMGMVVNGSVLTPYFNGTALNTKTGTTITATGINIGKYSGGQVWNGNVAEVIMIDGAIPDIQRQQIEGYLANKWGRSAQLPLTHPYYSNSSAIIRQPSIRTFQPSDISGLAFWLDGADRTSMIFSGSTISQWNDKSGNGYNATVASAVPGGTSTYTANATYSTNPLGVYFPTVNTAYTTAYPANPTSETAFIVARSPSPSSLNNMVVGGPRGARSMCYGYNPLTSCAYLNNEVVWLANTGAGTYTSNTTALVTGLISPNGGGSSSPTIAIHGGTMSGAIPTTFFNVNTVIGADTSTQGNNNTYHYIGYIMEIIFYNSQLTSTQIKQVESYLAQKWNIASSLVAGHPGRFLPSYTTMFTPKAIGPTLWLDAADASTITLSSGNVTAWADKSGTGYSAVPFTGDGGTITTSTTNGITSVYSSYPRMRIQNFTWDNAFTHFIVARASIFIDTGLSDVSSGGDYTNQYYYISSANWALFSINKTLYGADSRYIVTTPSYYQNPIPGVADTWVIFCIGCNLGSTLSHYTLNGVSGVSYLSNSGSVSAGSNTGYFTFNGLSYFSDGAKYMGEILHYNRSLTVSERQRVEGYLAWKWAIQSKLPSTHPYAKFQP
jgi:hypothetical protein